MQIKGRRLKGANCCKDEKQTGVMTEARLHEHHGTGIYLTEMNRFRRTLGLDMAKRSCQMHLQVKCTVS
jgi:hypothetical protein